VRRAVKRAASADDRKPSKAKSPDLIDDASLHSMLVARVHAMRLFPELFMHESVGGPSPGPTEGG